MKVIRSYFDRLFPNQEPLPPGVHHYQSPADAPVPFRLHLRIEEGGEGILVVNASTVLHLNQSATEYAYHLLKQTPPDEVSKLISKRYRVKLMDALTDFNNFSKRIVTLVETPDLDPTTYLDFERMAPHTTALTAPLRLDCALTYETSDEERSVYAPVDRVRRNLTSEEWKTALAKAWEAGIPHVVFTGGEPTLRPDLVDLVAYVEQLGMVAGILTDGLRLSETEYLHRLLQSGLDHLMLVLDPTDEQSWEALRDILAEDIYVTVHLTLSRRNTEAIPAVLEKLAELKVPSLSLSADSAGLKSNLETARELAAHYQIELVWDLPVPYSQLNPVALELQETGENIAGAGRSWLYVEPDGDVLPRQGVNFVLGNLVSEPWEQIWRKSREVAPV